MDVLLLYGFRFLTKSDTVTFVRFNTRQFDVENTGFILVQLMVVTVVLAHATMIGVCCR